MRSKVYRKFLGMFLLLCAFQLVMPGTGQATITNPYFTFEPTSGSPGTVVRLTGGQLWGNGGRVDIYIEPSDPTIPSRGPDDPSAGCRPGAPSGAPLGTAQADADGNWSATITIPRHLTSGQPITPGAICIVGPGGSKRFTILQGRMPSAGQSAIQFPATLALVSLMLIFVGGWLLISRQAKADRHGE